VLPSGETETGAWSYGGSKESLIFSSISFNIPLAEAPTAETIPAQGAPTANCPGTAEIPTAEPGFLCVYVDNGPAPDNVAPHAFGATLIKIDSSTPANVEAAVGSFAVTAE